MGNTPSIDNAQCNLPCCYVGNCMDNSPGNSLGTEMPTWGPTPTGSRQTTPCASPRHRESCSSDSISSGLEDQLSFSPFQSPGNTPRHSMLCSPESSSMCVEDRFFNSPYTDNAPMACMGNTPSMS